MYFVKPLQFRGQQD